MASLQIVSFVSVFVVSALLCPFSICHVVVSGNGNEVIETTDGLHDEKMNIECQYEEIFGYKCWAHDFNIRKENTEVTSFTGLHNSLKTDDDVSVIQFRNATMHYIPNGIGKLFKNLSEFLLRQNLGLKVLRRSNFKDMKKLYAISIYDNEVETIDEDSFYDLPNLYTFYLINNKLKVISEKLFEKNVELTVLDLSNNKLESLPRNLFKTNVKLIFVSFYSNRLKVIETEFGSLNILGITFGENDCITTSQYTTSSEKFKDFQSLVRANCSSADNKE